jgi:hypothetical protein
MTAGTALPPQVAEYLEAVRAELGDLPEAERDDLLAEVEPSLVAAAEEGGTVASHLGSPQEFAAELRAAAGLHVAAEPRTPSRLGRATRELFARLAGDPRAAAARRLGRDLAPLWWVARAYFAVGAVAFVLDWDWSTRVAFVPRIGDGATGLAVIVAAVVVSVWLGLQGRRHGVRPRRLALAVNLALLAAALPVALDVSAASGRDTLAAASVPQPTPAPAPVPGLVYDGVPVTNIYPYSRAGELLHDVLLYDGAGRPLEVGGNRGLDPDRRFVVTNGNRPVLNAFPIRYYEPGTKRVARPNAAPFVELPLVLTPPLPERAASR